ncbi:KR domain-containing protein [Xylariaceae sp. FL0662B]|nr:KR domain-containing protein [Xylariaceae sp. FL0662B]
MACWLVSRGARHIVLLSRSGPRTPEAHDLLAEITAKGIYVEMPRDVTDVVSLRSVLSGCRERMPPIKGCIQAAMVMKEAVFETMSFPDWKAAVQPKTKGSWNLHCVLPTGLDFFFMISSMGGIIGRISLAAYNAGNTHQDALAHYRVAHGERATSFDLGAVADEGYLAGHGDRMANFQCRVQVEMVYTKEIFALLDAHRVVGVRPPSHWKHLDDVLFFMSQPLWGHLHHVPTLPEGHDTAEAPTGQKQQSYMLEKMAAAHSVPAAAEVAGGALTRHVSSVLGTREESRPLHSYGIDSLSAIELRNWIAKVFRIDMPLLDIMGDATLDSMRLSIARECTSLSG